MLEPKVSVLITHWDNLSDDQLLALELEIDDPRTLAGLVFEVPDGDEEPHVEFKYDLRGQEVEEFSCVHGHHRHKAGFVMKKGNARFMVGHICGKSIYGEDFERYKADYDAAVNRRDTLVRVRELRQAVDAFMGWVNQVEVSGVLRAFNKLRGILNNQMPWIFDNLPALAGLAANETRAVGTQLPKWLCDQKTDIKLEFARLQADTAALALSLAGDVQKVATILAGQRVKASGLVRRAQMTLQKLSDVELFFQPIVLETICRYANEQDNPKRRRYQASLLSLSVRGIDKCKIRMPPCFKIPGSGPVDALERLIATPAGTS